MKGELVEMGVQIKKVLIFSVKSCYRLVLRHPFFVGMFVFLIFMYRSFPFVFSLLVSASPVIVCTAVLLGTLLSFGQPNIPEIEREEAKTTHEIASLRTGIMGDKLVAERINGLIDKSHGETSSVMGKVGSDSDNDVLSDAGSGKEERSREMEELRNELSDREFEHEVELSEEKMGEKEGLENHYAQIQHSEDETTEFEDEKLREESTFVFLKADNRQSRVGEGDDEDDVDDDEASDSGSDGAESSSPDASMADIIPMLDELHPLLEEDRPQPVIMSHDGSDAASEDSLESSSESDDDVVNQEELEVEDEEEEEEETNADKEDDIKAAITWTEDDQKNLMNLGTSELERNQRLENLIARRRARKNMRLMAEKNLIDLEGTDLPFNIPPISTTRNNPFDLPYDSNDNVPGSAPSILAPRRNPFDLPYDPNEEKPDLVGDGFEQDFIPLQPKEPIFRRHESFSVGHSFLGPFRQERHETRFKPVFLPERIAYEGTSNLSFQRQSSEISDKVSSVIETESVDSAGDQEDLDELIDGSLSQGPELISIADHISERAGDLEDLDEHIDGILPQGPELSSIAEHVSENGHDLEEDEHIDGVFPQRPELIFIAEHVSEHVGHGSHSSDDMETVEAEQFERRDDIIHHDVESSFSEYNGISYSMEINSNKIHHNEDITERKSSIHSSSSYVSEEEEKTLADKEGGEGYLASNPGSEYYFTESSNFVRPSTLKSDVPVTNLVVEDIHPKEPIYDSSPPAFEKNLSSSSISTDPQLEMSEICEQPDVQTMTVSLAEEVSEGSFQITNSNLKDSTSENAHTGEHSAVDEQCTHNIPDTSPETVSVKQHMLDKEVAYQFEQRNIPSAGTDGKVHENLEEADENMTSHYQTGSEDISRNEEDLPISEKVIDEQMSENPEQQEKFTGLVESRVDITEHHTSPTLADSNDVDGARNGVLLSAESLDSHLHFSEDSEDAEEIDETLLAELDAVGDFSVNEFGSNLKEMEKHLGIVEESGHNQDLQTIQDRNLTLQDSQTNPDTVKESNLRQPDSLTVLDKVGESNLRKQDIPTDLVTTAGSNIGQQASQSHLDTVGESNLRKQDIPTDLVTTAESNFGQQDSQSHLDTIKQSNNGQQDFHTDLDTVSKSDLEQQDSQCKLGTVAESNHGQQDSQNLFKVIQENNLGQPDSQTIHDIVEESNHGQQDFQTNLKVNNESNLGQPDSQTNHDIVEENNLQQQDSQPNLDPVKDRKLADPQSIPDIVEKSNLRQEGSPTNLDINKESNVEQQDSQANVHTEQSNPELQDLETNSFCESAEAFEAEVMVDADVISNEGDADPSELQMLRNKSIKLANEVLSPTAAGSEVSDSDVQEITTDVPEKPEHGDRTTSSENIDTEDGKKNSATMSSSSSSGSSSSSSDSERV